MRRIFRSRWILPGSLSLNVFFVVFLLVVSSPFGFRPEFPPPPSEMAERMARTLPPADAAIFRQAFAARETDLTRSREVHLSVPTRVRAVLSAPELDVASLKAVFDDARAAHEIMDSALESAMIEAVSKMSTEGRRKLSEWQPPRPPSP